MTDSVRRPQESAVDPLSEKEIARLEIQARMRELSLVPACESIGALIATIRGLEAENRELREAAQRFLVTGAPIRGSVGPPATNWVASMVNVDTFREALAEDVNTERVCSVCGGPWGLERPLCDYSKGGRCEGAYIMTKQAFAAIASASR